MALPVISATGACKAIQMGLNSLLADKTDFSTPNGFTQALLDSTNRSGVKFKNVISSQGHLQGVEILHKQRPLTSAVRTTESCVAGTENPRLATTIAINLHHEIPVTVSELTIRALCKAQSDQVKLGGNNGISVMRELAEDIALAMDPLETMINQGAQTSFATKIGVYKGGATTNTYDVMRSEDHSLLLKGFNLMKRDVTDMSFSGQPIMWGKGNMELALMSANYGCCNDRGQDFGVMRNNPGFKFYIDEYAATALGNANAFGAIMPGAAQLVTYNKYVGDFAGEDVGSIYYGTVPSMHYPGVDFDIILSPSGCVDRSWTAVIGLHYAVYVLPTTIFAATDRLVGVNGTVKGIAAATVTV